MIRTQTRQHDQIAQYLRIEISHYGSGLLSELCDQCSVLHGNLIFQIWSDRNALAVYDYGPYNALMRANTLQGFLYFGLARRSADMADFGEYMSLPLSMSRRYVVIHALSMLLCSLRNKRTLCNSQLVVLRFTMFIRSKLQYCWRLGRFRPTTCLFISSKPTETVLWKS